jgi:hypothetical protein
MDDFERRGGVLESSLDRDGAVAGVPHLRPGVFHGTHDAVVVGRFALAALGAEQSERFPRRGLPEAKAGRGASAEEVDH